MTKIQTEMVRVRLPKKVRARLEIEAQDLGLDLSKVIRKCLECYTQHPDCFAKKELLKLKEGR